MSNKLNILKPFLIDPEREYNIREIARILNISPATASTKLKKNKYLTKRKFKNLELYRANLDSKEFTDLKTYHTIKTIRNSLIDKLNKFYLKPTIVLFGSASLGLDTTSSDIDLLIISEKTTLIKDLPKILGRDVQIFVHRDIKGIKNKHLVNNILNGITLQGSIKWT